MPIKSSQTLVQEALKEIKTINTDEAYELSQSDKCNLIDIRDVRELEKEGRVENAVHIPRGMLEFWIDPESPYHKDIFNQNKTYVFYCASAWRSALSTKLAQDMGLSPVAHIDGGFTAWSKAKDKVSCS